MMRRAPRRAGVVEVNDAIAVLAVKVKPLRGR